MNKLFTLLVVVILIVISISLLTSQKNSSGENQQSISKSEQTNLVSTTNWQTFTHSSGEYSFRYPPTIKVSERGASDENKQTTIDFSNKDWASNHTYLYIEKESNAFNRSLVNHLKIDSKISDTLFANYKNITVNSQPALEYKDRFGQNTNDILLQKGNSIYAIRFYNSGENKEDNEKIYHTLLSTLSFNPPTKNAEIITVVEGDLYLNQNGKETKLTNHGYNYFPSLSPDKTKIAFLSKSDESFENEKSGGPYPGTSSNIWIINIDGTNPVQVTTHVDAVFRRHLLWLDNNRLLFVEGEESAKLYNLSDKTTKTVLGPEKPVGACYDACGSETKYFYSPDNLYLLRLTSVSSGIVVPAGSAILNTKTFEVKEITHNVGIDFNTLSFPNNTTLNLKGYQSGDYNKKIDLTINLQTAQVSTK